MNAAHITAFEQAIADPGPSLIVTHKDPDFDAIGSALGLMHWLTQRQVSAQVWCRDAIPASWSFLPGVEDVGSAYPSQEFESLWVLDCSDRTRVNGTEILDKKSFKKQINIDHHSDNTQFGDINITTHISSVSEMLAQLFYAIDGKVSADIATCLYAGLIYDTGRFHHPNVTQTTFEIAAKLVDAGVNSSVVSAAVFDQLNLSAAKWIGVGLDRLVVDENIGLGYTSLPKCGAQDGRELVDLIRQLSVVKVFLLFRQVGAQIKVNLRSKTDFDVAKFAHQYGGGGHQKAAGMSIDGKLDETVTRVIDQLKQDLSCA